MKIVVTSRGADLESRIDPRFGRAACFLLVDTASGAHEVVDNAQNLNAVQGAGVQAGQTVAGTGADAVVTGNVGPKAFRVLSAAGIKVYLTDECLVKEAVSRFIAGELTEQDTANVEGHW